MSRRTTLAAAVLAPLLVAGCGSGQDAQTYQERTLGDATNSSVGALALRNIAVLPPPTEGVWEEGSDVPVSVAVINAGSEPDRLVEVTSDVTDDVQVLQTGVFVDALEVPPLGPAEGYSLLLRDVTRDLVPGRLVTVTFRFEANGEVEVLVPVSVTNTQDPEVAEQAEQFELPEPDSEGNPIPPGEGEEVARSGEDAEGSGE